MFYYPLVLQRSTGRFSTIWLAATRGIKLPRRDFLKVNVQRTCSDILDYVLVRIPPPQPCLPRPRFSLYLSSQLQYGVVVVYHRQCDMLLEEIQTTLDRLAKNRNSKKIDLDYRYRHSLCLPDAQFLLEECEGAQDPFFGQMNVGDMLSPRHIILLGEDRMGAGPPERPLQLSPGTWLLPAITASPDTITLVEREPLVMPSVEFEGVELAEVTSHVPGMIDLLMDQPDYYLEEEMEMERRGGSERERRPSKDKQGRPSEEGRPREKERGSEVETEGPRAIQKSALDLQPTTMSIEDPVMLPQEETGKPLYMPAAAAVMEERTPGSVPLPSTPPGPEEGARKLAREMHRRSPSLQELTPPEMRPERTRRRRRQLLFADEETQLSMQEQQQQLDDPLLETRGLADLLPRSTLFRQGLLPPASLMLSTPCLKQLPPELLRLWNQAAVLTPLPGSALQMGPRSMDSSSPDSDRDREGERVATNEELQEEPVLELSSKEFPREMAVDSELFLPDSSSSITPLEGSDLRELSREIPQLIPEIRGTPVLRSVSRLQNIPEEERNDVLFSSLLPPQADRKTVSHSFWVLLEMVTARKLCVHQEEPYGEIAILTGTGHEEEEEV